MLDMYGIIIIFVFCLLYFFLFLLGKWTSGKYGMTFIFFMFFITFFELQTEKCNLVPLLKFASAIKKNCFSKICKTSILLFYYYYYLNALTAFLPR